MLHRLVPSALVALGLAPLSVSAQGTQGAENIRRAVEIETSQVSAPDVAISPNGEWFVFTLAGHLHRLPVEGGEAEQLTEGPFYDKEPAISPDGRRIAFISDRGGSSGNVFLPDLESGAIHRLTDEVEAERPAWSPDGNQIAYLAFEAPRPIEPWFIFPPSLARVRVVAVVGGATTTVTDDPDISSRSYSRRYDFLSRPSPPKDRDVRRCR